MMLMMMALKEDSRYGLFSRDSLTAANITCIHVKLTDSALRFIEDSVKSNVCVIVKLLSLDRWFIRILVYVALFNDVLSYIFHAWCLML